MEALSETLHKESQAAAFEKNLPAATRLRNGQYYTPTLVCDLMLSLSTPVIASEKEPLRILEPGCGPGTFLSRLIAQWDADENPLTTRAELTGIELDAAAAELARTLLPQQGNTYTCTIHTMNFISPEVDALGLFDWIIGNPPYVRQEYLAQSQQLDKRRMLSYLLAKYADYVNQFPEQKALFSQTADLYILFFLQATTLLKPGGRLAFITSNSWLNTAYGQSFQQFLTHHFHVHALAESACERWFEEAAINSIITVLEKKDSRNSAIKSSTKSKLIPDKIKGQNNPVNLIRYLIPLHAWLPKVEQPSYWRELAITTQTRNTASDIQQSSLCNELKQEQLTQAPFKSNWALPLRCSTEFMQLLNHAHLWQKLEDLGRVRYPIKTGINAFFYVNAATAQQWGIEAEFLFPVLRSSRQVNHYRVHADRLQEALFSCPLSKAELAQQGKTGALHYILWGESQSAPPRQKRSHAVPWPQVASVKTNRPWHYVKPLPPAHILCPRFIDQRFFFPLCEGKMMEDQTFYGLTLHQTENRVPLLMAALLNSTLSYWLAEYSARTSLGEGVLQFARGDMATFSIINPDLFSAQEKDALIDAFQHMCNRTILPLEQELFSPDRITLDLLMLKALYTTLQIEQDVQGARERLATQLLARAQERRFLARSVRAKNESVYAGPPSE